jgi:TfoX/Sxy family transcriptional regulator of competence genes
MFGGLAFLVDGNMAVAASGEGGLMVRVDPADADDLLTRPGVQRMEMRGRPLRGWLRVDAAELGTARQLATWVRTGVRYARTLPPKPGAATRP